MGNATLARRDTSAGFVSGNPVLAAGEHGYETDTEATKIGDGVTAWGELPYSWPNPTQGSLSSAYAPASGSPNYATPTQAAGLSAALSIVFGG